MKKKAALRFSLHRETLRALENDRGLAGGVGPNPYPTVTRCGMCGPLTISRCGGCATEGTYDTCINTYACSTGCETGGMACTALTCYC